MTTITLTSKDKREILKGMAEGVLDLDRVPSIANAIQSARLENPYLAMMKEVFIDTPPSQTICAQDSREANL